MKIQKFRGTLKETGEVVDNLRLYKDDKDESFWFIKDLTWIDEERYDALMYLEWEFENIEEYFEEG